MTSIKTRISKFILDNRHFLLLLYFLIYLPWFNYLETNVTTHFHVIHMRIDYYIPFCEYFIVPYMLWFAYVAWGMIFIGFNSRMDFYKLCTVLFTGMTVFLIISTVYPNGHFLRPYYFNHNNIFTQMCSWLYSTDTATNLFPSIHVFNSLAVHFAVMNNETLKKHKPVQMGSLILCVSIILSTVFVKQHSVFDVLTALGLGLLMYILVYKRDLLNHVLYQKATII